MAKAESASCCDMKKDNKVKKRVVIRFIIGSRKTCGLGGIIYISIYGLLQIRINILIWTWWKPQFIAWSVVKSPFGFVPAAMNQWHPLIPLAVSVRGQRLDSEYLTQMHGCHLNSVFSEICNISSFAYKYYILYRECIIHIFFSKSKDHWICPKSLLMK